MYTFMRDLFRARGVLFFSIMEILWSRDRPYRKLLDDATPLRVEFPAVERRILHGVPIYSVRSSEVPLASFQLILEGGAAADPEGMAGVVSQMAEMVVFSGSQSHDREILAQYLENRGSLFGVNCDLERCIFRLQSLSHYFVQDLGVVLQVLQKPRFAAEDWEILQKRVLRKIEERWENPSTLLSLVLRTQGYPNNFRGAIVSKRSVWKTTVEDFRRLHNLLFQKKNISLALAGSFDTSEVYALLEDFCSKLSDEGGSFFREKLAIIPPQPVGVVYHLEKDIPQTYLAFQARGLPHHDKRYTAWRLFDAILGGESFNSVLVQNIRTKKGWAYNVYSAIDSDAYHGTILISVQTENKNLDDVVDEIRRLLANPKEYLTERRLQESKDAMLNKMVFLYETPEQFLNLYLSLIWDGLDESYLNQLPQKIREVTLADVEAIARELYDNRRFFLAIVGPSAGKNGPVYKLPPSLFD